MEVRYLHSLPPRACGHVYTIMRGPLTADGGFDTANTNFHEPEGAKCTCAADGKRTAVNLHMLNPTEMAELGTVEKRGVEYVEVAIAMTKADDDDDADGTPEIAEDLPYVEAKKPKAKAKAKAKPKPKRKKPKAEAEAPPMPEPMTAVSPPPTGPTEHGDYAAPWTPPAEPEKPAETAPERSSTWPFGDKST